MEDKRFREVRNACRMQEHLIYRRDDLSPMISAVERSGAGGRRIVRGKTVATTMTVTSKNPNQR